MAPRIKSQDGWHGSTGDGALMGHAHAERGKRERAAESSREAHDGREGWALMDVSDKESPPQSSLVQPKAAEAKPSAARRIQPACPEGRGADQSAARWGRRRAWLGPVRQAHRVYLPHDSSAIARHQGLAGARGRRGLAGHHVGDRGSELMLNV